MPQNEDDINFYGVKFKQPDLMHTEGKEFFICSVISRVLSKYWQEGIFSDCISESILPYFFVYDRFFSFQNNHKNLDPSYKMDLDL